MSGRKKKPAAVSVDAKPVSASRIWMFRVLAVVLVPLVLLGACELGLRALGYGHSTSFVTEFDRGGRTWLRDNPGFYTLFFPSHLLPKQLPFVVPASKPAGEVRVLLLGGSAAMGIPEPAYGMGAMLVEQLRFRHPNVDVRVLNLANTAINSHVVRRVAEQIDALEPDAIVVYLGNNEVVGPFGAGTVFGKSTPSAGVISSQIRLRSTRIGQAAVALGARLRGSGELPSRWRGMAMFAEHSISPDDPALDRVREHFESNLRAIADVGRRLGVPVVMASVGVNQRHCAPFASVHGEGVDLPSFDAAFDSANAAWERGDLAKAHASYSQALEFDPSYAEVRYRMGRLSLLLGDTLAARADLLEAIELDGLRFRADRSVNEIIARVASESDAVVYAPLGETLSRVSPAGLAGRELFWEHVHLDLQGNRLAGQVLATQLEAVLGWNSSVNSGSAWPDVGVLTSRLAYTLFDRFEQVSQIGALVSAAPFISLSDQPEQIGRLSNELEQLRAQVHPDSLPKLWPVYERAMTARPDSWIRKFRAASFLTNGLRDFERADPLWRQLTTELPHFPAALNGYARALSQAGKHDAAVIQLERSLALNEHQLDMKMQLSAALRLASPRDPGARWRAMRLEREVYLADQSDVGAARFRDRCRSESKWFGSMGEFDNASQLERWAEEVESDGGE